MSVEVSLSFFSSFSSSQSAVDGLHEREDLGGVVAVEVVGVDGPNKGAGQVHVVGKLTLKGYSCLIVRK